MGNTRKQRASGLSGICFPATQGVAAAGDTEATAVTARSSVQIMMYFKQNLVLLIT